MEEVKGVSQWTGLFPHFQNISFSSKARGQDPETLNLHPYLGQQKYSAHHGKVESLGVYSHTHRGSNSCSVAYCLQTIFQDNLRLSFAIYNMGTTLSSGKTFDYSYV